MTTLYCWLLLLGYCYGCFAFDEDKQSDGQNKFLIFNDDPENPAIFMVPSESHSLASYLLDNMLDSYDRQLSYKRAQAFTPRIGRKKRSTETSLLERMMPAPRVGRGDQDVGGIQLRAAFIPRLGKRIFDRDEDKRARAAFTPRIGRTAFTPRLGR
ncbi:uncharacterized protein [Centruroides vittatus]|uniref:uncharacterized protein n=1 Tax=Centruroides vittatus TaxID=120091 RepID=UPI003510BDCF